MKESAEGAKPTTQLLHETIAALDLPTPPSNEVSVETPEVSLQTHTFKEAFDICLRECGRQRRHQRTFEAQFDATLNAALEKSERDFQIGREMLFRLIDEEKTTCTN